MDQDTAVMTAIIIALCTLPFAFIYFKQKAAEKGLLSKIKGLAAAHGGSIHISRCEAGMAIGIDTKAGQLYFCTAAELGGRCTQLSLDDYSQCRPYKLTSTRGRGADRHEVIEKLGLALQPRLKAQSDTLLLIYDADEISHLGSHIEIMETWTALVQAHLKTKPAHNSVLVA